MDRISLHPLEWDSQFFGIPIARLSIPPESLHPSVLSDALMNAKKERFDCLYFEVPFEDPDIVSFCSAKEFFLVDFKTTLTKELTDAALSVEDEGIATSLDESYYPSLEKIAEGIALKSRFNFDPRFGREEAKRLYREWLRKSFFESFCSDFIVYLREGSPAGLLTLRFKNDALHIDLFGVAEEHRSQGVGGKLILAGEKRAKTAGHEKLFVVTQGHNAEALRTYQKHGFRIQASNIFYHIWLGQTP